MLYCAEAYWVYGDSSAGAFLQGCIGSAAMALQGRIGSVAITLQGRIGSTV